MAYKEYPAKNKYMISNFGGISDHEHISEGLWKDAENMTCDEAPAAKTRPHRVAIETYKAITPITRGYSSPGLHGYYVFAWVGNNMTPPATPFKLRFYKNGDAMELNCTSINTAGTLEEPVKELACEFDFDQNGITYEEAKDFVIASTGDVEWPQKAMLPGIPVDSCVIDEDLFIATDQGWITNNDTSINCGAELRQIVPIGKQIYTNNGWFMKNDLTDAKQSFLYLDGAAQITLCNEEGSDLTIPNEKPANPDNGDYYFDPDSKGLYRYSDAQERWVSVTTGLIKLKFTATYHGWNKTTSSETTETVTVPDLSDINKNDAVRMRIPVTDIPFSATEEFESTYTVHSVNNTEHEIILNGLIDVTPNYVNEIENEPRTEKLNVCRRMPVMDYICEHNNRIWGCRYGEDNDGVFVNEIYACEQGNPLNWYLLERTAADSWTASVGEPGAWTGCCALGEYVLFFKRNRIFIISGTEPSNFGYTQLDDYGIQPGSDKSIAIIDNYAYYKSEHGIMRIGINAYPVCISRALGDDRWTDAIAGADGRKYYISMFDGTKRRLYVYDIENGSWMAETEPDEHLRLMQRYKNNLLAIGATANETITGVELKLDQAKSDAAKSANYVAWLVKYNYTQELLRLPLSGIAAKFGAATASGLVTAIETQTTAGNVFIDAEASYAANVNYVYINHEKPRDLELIGEQYVLTNWNLTKTKLTVIQEKEPQFHWFAETGAIGLNEPDEKYMRVLQIRVKSEENAHITVKARYDEETEWKELRHENRGKTGTYRVAFAPAQRYDMMQLRFEGLGDTVLFSITPTMEDAGDYVR